MTHVSVHLLFLTDARGSNVTERVFHSEAGAAPGSNWTCWGWKGQIFIVV